MSMETRVQCCRTHVEKTHMVPAIAMLGEGLPSRSLKLESSQIGKFKVYLET